MQRRTPSTVPVAAVVAAMLLMLGACGAPDPGPTGSVTSVAIDQGDQMLAVAETITLSVTVQSSGTVDTDVVWTSDDASVASVDASGVVTATGVGTTRVQASSVAASNVRDDIDVTVVESVLDPANAFTVAIVPSGSAETIAADVDTVSAALAAELGRDVAFTVQTSFFGVLQGLLDASVTLSVLGPTAVVQAMDEGGATVELTAVRGGETSYRGEFYARCDDGATSIDALSGARFGFVDPGSVAGYQVPYLTLIDAGLDPDTDLDTVFAGSHDAVILGIYTGALDAGVAFEGAVATIEGEFADVRDVVCSIGFTTDIPNDGLVVRGGVAPRERAAIAAAWMTALESPATAEAMQRLVGVGDFAPATVEDYDIIRRVMDTFSR